MNRNQIMLISGTDYKEMTLRLLEAADLAGHIPSKDCRIGIKPNLVSLSSASNGATTHPEIVEGIIEYLKAHGFFNLFVMEGSWVGDSTREVAELCGYLALCEREKVPFRDLQKDKAFTKDCGGMKLSLCETAGDVDFLINVPVLKGHCQTKITCALKNLKGMIPNKEKRRFHSMGLHKPIAHLNAGIHQDFIVVDNICGDLDFEDGGNPVVMNRILAAADPVLLDTYVCHLLHYDVSEVPYIGLSEALGVGTADLGTADICLVDRAEEDAAGKPEEQPLRRPRKVVEVCDQVEEVESCSACYGYLIPALSRLKEEGLLSRLEDKICIGQGYRGKSGRLGVGNCTRQFELHVEGCPPTENQIYDFLRCYLQKESTL